MCVCVCVCVCVDVCVVQRVALLVSSFFLKVHACAVKFSCKYECNTLHHFTSCMSISPTLRPADCDGEAAIGLLLLHAALSGGHAESLLQLQTV